MYLASRTLEGTQYVHERCGSLAARVQTVVLRTCLSGMRVKCQREVRGGLGLVPVACLDHTLTPQLVDHF